MTGKFDDIRLTKARQALEELGHHVERTQSELEWLSRSLSPGFAEDLRMLVSSLESAAMQIKVLAEAADDLESKAAAI